MASKLRLRELVLAEASSIGWEHRPTHFPGGPGKCQESNLCHRACCLLANGPWLRAGALKFSLVWSKDVNRANPFRDPLQGAECAAVIFPEEGDRDSEQRQGEGGWRGMVGC